MLQGSRMRVEPTRNYEQDLRQIAGILDLGRRLQHPRAQEAPKFKDFILPLIFTKRLCDVFDDELNRIAEEVGSAGPARTAAQDPVLPLTRVAQDRPELCPTPRQPALRTVGKRT
jgi:hypothetical protein